MGTSPIEINGVNNRIGYWTLKSWLSIPEEHRPEGSDNDLKDTIMPYESGASSKERFVRTRDRKGKKTLEAEEKKKEQEV